MTLSLQHPLDRREFLRATMAIAASGALAACRDNGPYVPPNPAHARLTARPIAPTTTAAAGISEFMTNGRTDALVFAPSTYDPGIAWPLMVALHGSGGSASDPIQLLSAYAEERGFIILAIESRAYTWDTGFGDYGADIAVMDRSLARAFDSYNVAADKIFLEGHSDGATYALGVGLTNGDLFARTIAFSPGYLLPYETHGNPPVWISHGVYDTVLPIDQTSRRIVPQLQAAGYAVEYHEYLGDHWVPGIVVSNATMWMLG